MSAGICNWFVGVVAVISGPPLIVYVNVYGAVPLAPLIRTVGEFPLRQAEAVPIIVAVGPGVTVTVAEPLAGCVQPVVVQETLTRLYVNVPTTFTGTGISIKS